MKRTVLIATLVVMALTPLISAAQDFVMSREQMIAWTPEWKGERFPDGRPKVPDSILDRMTKVKLADAWSVLRNNGYEWQYEGQWEHVHLDDTTVMVGRAVTATFMPKRKDIDDALNKKGQAEGRLGGRNSWPIDTLKDRDVYVADLYDSFEGGPAAGGNLATAISVNSNNGVVFYGAIRDVEQIVNDVPGFKGWVKNFHPSYNYDGMLMFINMPTRIGVATVMPGDVVLASREGVMFIPPHLAELVCKTAELVQLRDLFGFQRIREKKYTPGQIDQKWSDAMEKDFSTWLNDHMDKLPVGKEQIQELLKERTW